MRNKSFESKQRKIILETKYRHSDRRRSGNLVAAKAMFLLAGVISLLALFYDNVYAFASFSNVRESAASSNLSQAATTNMIADNLFILAVPLAILFLVSQTFLLQQIREKVSAEKGGV